MVGVVIGGCLGELRRGVKRGQSINFIAACADPIEKLSQNGTNSRSRA